MGRQSMVRDSEASRDTSETDEAGDKDESARLSKIGKVESKRKDGSQRHALT